jgi:hypothetical protein
MLHGVAASRKIKNKIEATMRRMRTEKNRSCDYAQDDGIKQDEKSRVGSLVMTCLSLPM